MRRLVALPYSPWSIKARWALDHHGIEHTYEVYTPMLGEPGLRARLGWPRGPVTVPIFFDAGTVLRESVEIAQHAEAIGRGAKLFPEGRERDVLHWNGLGDVIARAGRALLTPRLVRDPDALLEAMSPSIPRPLRRASLPAAEVTVRYIARKHQVREEEAEKDRGTIRWTLSRLREAIERSDYILGEPSYADIAMVVAMQFVKPSPAVAPLGPATVRAWTDEPMAREHADLLAWRDRIVRKHHHRAR